MSDVVAAAVANTTEAQTESVETKPTEGAAPAKARTPDDDFEDLLKKSGGLKYKAKGKEKAVTTVSDLRRLLSSRDEIEAGTSEALKKAQEGDHLRQQLASLKQMRPLERAKALAALVGDEQTVREAYEELFISEDEKAKQDAHLSQREREMKHAIEERDAELQRFRGESERAAKQRQVEEHAARVQEVGQRLEKVAVAALQKAKIQGENAPHFLQAIAERLDRNERLGLGLDESEIADVVMGEHRNLASTFVKGMAPPDLADMLDECGLTKSLCDELARRIRARVAGPQAAAPVRVNGSTHADSTPLNTDNDKRKFWSTFGNQR